MIALLDPGTNSSTSSTENLRNGKITQKDDWALFQQRPYLGQGQGWGFFPPSGFLRATERNGLTYTPAYDDASRDICALHRDPCPVRFSLLRNIARSPNVPHLTRQTAANAH